MANEEHEIELHFTSESSNTRTAIHCTCGEDCGSVVTGTRIPVILEIYREHLRKLTE